MMPCLNCPNKALLAALIVVGAPMVATAQFNPFAPTSAMDELNAAPVGGPNFALERARGAVGQANQRPEVQADPFGAAPASDPFGGGFGDPFGGAFGGDPFAVGAFGGFGETVQNALEPTVTAIAGERVFCARTGAILRDAREIQILASARGQYFDDGRSGGDAVAGDNIFTNVTTSEEMFISPEAHAIRTMLLRTLQFGIDLNPMSFNLERVASTDPITPLPRILDLEAAQDVVLADWLATFLRDFRMDPADPASPLIPTFMPPPPRAPNIPLPVNFTPIPPPTAPGQGGFGGAGGTLFDGGVTGDPIGNASSRYF